MGIGEWIKNLLFKREKEEIMMVATKLKNIEKAIEKYNEAVKKHNELAFGNQGELLEIEIMEDHLLKEIFGYIKALGKEVEMTMNFDLEDKYCEIDHLIEGKVKQRKATEYDIKDIYRKLDVLDKKLEALKYHQEHSS